MYFSESPCIAIVHVWQKLFCALNMNKKMPMLLCILVIHPDVHVYICHYLYNDPCVASLLSEVSKLIDKCELK